MPSSGTILNATTGSAIVSTVSGLTVNSAARTYSYNGSGSAGSTNNGLTETLAGATFSPRGNVVTIVSAAVPAFTSNPSISPQGGNVGGTFSGIDGAMSNGGSILSRRWLLNGTSIGSGTTVVPASAGSLVFENTGTGNVVASSTAVTVAAVAGTPSIAFAAPTASVAEGDSGTKIVSNVINVTRNGVTGPLTVSLSYSGTATSGTDYVAGPVSGTIADGQTSLSFDLTINGDTGVESDETIVINAVLDGYSSATTSKTITVTNDDVTSTPGSTPSAVAGPTPTAGTLSTFSYEPEAATLFSAYAAKGYTPTTGRKRTINRYIQRSKAAGIWALDIARYIPIPDSPAASLINIKNPGVNDLVVEGSPSFVDPRAGVNAIDPNTLTNGYNSSPSGATTFTATPGNRLNTGIQLKDLPVNDVRLGGFFTGSGSTNFECGAQDPTTGYGIAFAMKSGGGTMAAKAMGAASNTMGATASWSANKMATVQRRNATQIEGWSGPTLAATVTNAAQTMTSFTQPITFLEMNGLATPASTAKGFLGGVIGRALSMTQMQEDWAAYKDLVDSIQWGDVDIRGPGFLPAQVDVDVVVNGWTAFGCAASYRVVSRGKSCAFVGAFNDFTTSDFGGVTANGLGYTDVKDTVAFGGLARWMVTRARAVDGAVTAAGSGAAFQLRPRSFNVICRQMLDGSRPQGRSVTAYATGGVIAVTKNGTGAGTTYTVKTLDGRTFTCKRYIDCSYEGNAGLALGLPLTYGREASGSGLESLGGWSGTTSNTTRGDGRPQGMTVDPWKTPGDPSSGVIFPLKGIMPTDKTVGQADDQVQMSNYRFTAGGSAVNGWNWSQIMPQGSPPPGYDPANYELPKRMSVQTAYSQTSSWFMLQTALPGVNNQFDHNTNAFSTDFSDSGNIIANAGLDRDKLVSISNKIRDNILGFYYDTMYSGDTRYASTLAANMAADVLPVDSHLDPSPLTGRLGFPNQMYLRERFRMRGGVGGAFFLASDAVG
ncbi:hypothetical protein ASE69_03585 [Sphingomonas sp. Leaf208]|nr:hypothetical protein ASE69_03585 [Sphingomonas sp. Leaf208]